MQPGLVSYVCMHMKAHLWISESFSAQEHRVAYKPLISYNLTVFMAQYEWINI